MLPAPPVASKISADQPLTDRKDSQTFVRNNELEEIHSLLLDEGAINGVENYT